MSDDLQRRTRAYYNSDVVEGWLEHVYAQAGADHFPFGLARELVVRAAITRHEPQRDLAYDLGCGGGQLTIVLAAFGFRVRAVDFSAPMLAKARAAVDDARVGDRVEFVQRDVLEVDPAGGSTRGHLAIAMGFVEYCPDPARFFARVRGCLRPGGLAIVEFRNRVFNAFIGNDHTAREASAGELPRLVREASERWAVEPPQLGDIETVVQLINAARLPEPAASPGRPVIRPFPGDRVQHTFDEITSLSAAAGLEVVEFLGLHPHPFPPAVERSVPVAYNALAWSMQQAPRNPLVLMCCSSAAAVLRAPM